MPLDGFCVPLSPCAFTSTTQGRLVFLGKLPPWDTAGPGTFVSAFPTRGTQPRATPMHPHVPDAQLAPRKPLLKD